MPESAGLGPARSSRCPSKAGEERDSGSRDEAGQCFLCAYRGHSSMRNAHGASLNLFPQAACSAPLCTFTDRLPSGQIFFPIRI